MRLGIAIEAVEVMPLSIHPESTVKSTVRIDQRNYQKDKRGEK